jgi:murein DD-endopeptidase MepM/ murein hydrolase activator NlpD
MITARWPRCGLFLALLALLAVSLLAPGGTLAQDAPAPPADTVPPIIVQPNNLVVAAVDGSGAAVNYAIPTANDETDGPVAVACVPAPGTIFPLGGTLITCGAHDAAGNQAAVTFTITDTDQTPPVITWPADIVVDAMDATGAVVNYAAPAAVDNVNGAVAVGCTMPAGSLFPVGTTAVTCSAQDAAGNVANPVTFHVTVNPPPPPPPPPSPTPTATATPPPTATEEATATEPATATETATTTPEATATETPSSTSEPTITATPSSTSESTATATETVTSTPTPGPATGAPTPTATAPATETPQATAASTPTNTLVSMADAATEIKPAAVIEVPTPKSTPTQAIPSIPVSIPTPAATATATVEVPAALELPWPPPADFILVTDGGPIDGLSAIWNNQDFPISQEFGHTEFSVQHYSWYAYGADYGLDGYEHPGIDIAMPAGTPLYSPVDGVVKVAGGVPYYTYYGNGQPGVGELLIETADGNEVILGHMGRITVQEGQRVEAGQFVGLSGGDNGDHLHLETREIQPWDSYRIVDPRHSFLIPALENRARQSETKTPVDDESASRRTA